MLPNPLRRLFGLPKQITLPIYPDRPSIVLPVIITQGSLSLETRMLLDTGATFVVIRHELATALNMKPKDPIQVTTATGTSTAYPLILPKLTIAGKTETKVEALAASLPEEAHVDGLLGLSLLKRWRVDLDFQRAELRLC